MASKAVSSDVLKDAVSSSGKWLAEPRNSCNKCSEEFDKQIDLITHHTKVHNRGNDGEFEICEECDEEFYKGKTYRWHLSKVHDENVRKKVECTNCGDMVRRYVSEVDRFENHFCSKDCQHDWVSGENHHNWRENNQCRNYGPNWKQQRKKCLERDFHRCRCCQMSQEECIEKYGRGLPIHHRSPFKHFDERDVANRLRNLITLCPYCHRKVESEITTPF